MDYSIFDAIRAGFGKVVFVIRKDFEQDFREKVLSKYETIFRSKWSSSQPPTCPQGSPVPLTAPNRGARTTPY